jgi:hypothetical protein
VTPDLNPFIAELRTLVAATWPEVLPDGLGGGGGGILEAEHADKIEWKTLRLPYAVILVTGMQLWADGPMTALWYQVTPQIWYVAAVSGPSSGIRAKLKSLADVFFPTDPLTTAQRWQMGAPQWGDDLRPNQVFAASGHEARAGVLPITCVIGS